LLAAAIATQNRAALLASGVLDGGNTRFSASTPLLSAAIQPDKIVMGDGILEGYKQVGLGDVAPQGIYAYEFAHHIKYDNGYIDEPIPRQNETTSAAEETRYPELMADAMAAYYLTHKRGGAMNQKRVEQFLQILLSDEFHDRFVEIYNTLID